MKHRTLKHRTLMVAGSVAALFALFVSLALAASIRNEGKVSGAPDSTVVLKVVTSGGEPTEVKAFKVTGVPAHCDGGANVLSTSFKPVLEVAKHGNFSGEVSSNQGPGGFFKLSGKVKNGGHKLSGTLSIDKSFSPPRGECRTGNKSWTAKSGG